MEKTLHSITRAIVTALACVVVLTSALAQMPTGTILGTVKDGSGAVIPDAALTVRNTETGFVRTLKSATNGGYRVAALPVGTYEIRAEQMGFQTEVRSSVSLAVGQEAVVNFSLQVGAVEQTVEVTGEAPLVNTTSGSLGTLVNEQQVADLPLNGRNYVDLTLLQPGVVQHRPSTQALSSIGTWMVVNGAPPRSNFYMLDGAPMNNYADAATASAGGNTLGVEAIREWRVVTSAISAEYGMRMGGQMVIVTRSGTNSLHGSLFEYVRNSVFDARNFFDYKTVAFTRRLPAFRRNQFGGSVGGPIKKDALFFFTTYEQLIDRLGVTTVVNTIAAGCKGPAGATITNVNCPQLGTTASATVAPVIAPLLALYPDPNLPGNRYTFPSTQPTDERYGMVRGDYNFSANDNLFIRYTIDDGQKNTPLAYPQFRRANASRSYFLTASESHTFASALVGTFRFSYSQPTVAVDSDTEIRGAQYSFSPGRAMGQLTVEGVTAMGAEAQSPSKNTITVFSYSGDLFYSKGRHSLKFGSLVNRYAPATTEHGTGTLGSVSFSSLANFLRGSANSYSALTPGNIRVREYYANTFGFYLQDDLRARSNLTLNLGLRYEFHSSFLDGKGLNSSLRDVQRDRAFTIGENFRNPSFKNFSPRVGFAWDVRGDGKTAVRGGFGLLYDIGGWIQAMTVREGSQHPWSTDSSVNSTEFPQYATITTLPLQFPPELRATGASTMEYLMQNPHLLSYSLTVERQLPYDIALSLGYAGSRGINLLDGKAANPRRQTVLADGRFFWAGNEPRVNPNWSGIGSTNSAASSFYNSLQFVLTKRLSRGLQFQSSYTWSKLIDEHGGITGPDNGGSPIIGNQLLPKSLDHGPAEYTVAHAWRFNTIYRLPQVSSTWSVAGALLNGWWVSGIVTAQTGLPFTVTTGGSDRSRSLGAGNVPDLNPGRWNPNIISGTSAGCTGVAAGQKLGGTERYFDPCAFSLEPIGFLGTEGRNILTAPGVANLDFSLVKDTKLRLLGEGGNIQLRAEAFNILNHANFSRPIRGLFSAPNATPLATAGQITSTDTTSRQVQLALKVIW